MIAISYQKPERLQARLESLVDNVRDFKGVRMAGIDSTTIQNRSLELVIPKGTATALQQAILNHLKNYGATNKVTVNIRQIP